MARRVGKNSDYPNKIKGIMNDLLFTLASFGAGNGMRVMHNLPGCTSPSSHPQHPK
jgi:hypothetical protein